MVADGQQRERWRDPQDLPGAIAFEAGHRYRVSFDYQTTYADQYRVRLGGDSIIDGAVTTTNLVSEVLPQTLSTTRWNGEFDASCGAPFIAIDKMAGQNTQHNMTIDSLRVEDLGESSGVCLDGSITANASVEAGGALTVTTKVVAISGALTDVKHALTLPEGWTSSVTTPVP
ncbi:hypothetical protein G7085_13185 [Tessaracoccus sp. HDW20]|uniref:hypothetical protein n=1 Tax=Tessaracoccus coleopterorum TaxID=2714950 RepID=UPI0018D3FAE0|nr:hypothetical protein [Tessaracoccus coleopterorum]NHB85265.1 hypothetical protein [Tessaracoccus coleopterorum]